MSYSIFGEVGTIQFSMQYMQHMGNLDRKLAVAIERDVMTRDW